MTYTEEENPELLLTVYDENDNEVTSGIDGLEYKENIKGVSGFDITDKQNSFTLSDNNEIKVEEKDAGQKEETWKIKVTLINYEYDQQVNTGKTFHAGLVITKDNLESYKITKVTGATVKRLSNSLTATLEVEEGNQQVEGYYFAKEEIGAVTTVDNVDEYTSHEYIKSETNTYTFNDLKENTNYKIYSYAQDINGFKSPIYVTDLIATEKIYTFTYTGNEQEFVPPQDGIYKIELWGASGGDASTFTGGKGAYTVGNISLTSNDLLYLYVGSKGATGDREVISTVPGGYNGGGNGYINRNMCLQITAGGGGATDIRLIENNLNSRIMVAGGGGGAYSSYCLETDYIDATGGDAGGLNGFSANYIRKSGFSEINPTGGTQINGGMSVDDWTAENYTTNYSGTFGKGADGDTLTSSFSGGGGGYYGGASGRWQPGGGGSSYISGYLGCVSITSSESIQPKNGCSDNTQNFECSYHYSGKKFTDANMIAGNASMPTHDGKNTMTGNSGDGYAKITLVG